MQSDDLDRAIDDVVRGMTAAEPPAGLPRRVLRRLATPAPRRRLFTGPRLAFGSAAVLCLLILGMVVGRDERARRAPQVAETTEAPEMPATAPSAAVTDGGRRDLSAPVTPSPARSRGSGRYDDRRGFASSAIEEIDRVVIPSLEVPRPIEVEPLAIETVQIADIEIAPLQVEAVRVDPLASLPR